MAIDLRPAKEDINAYAGDTLPIRVTVEGDLTGAIWKGEVRKARADAEVAATFTVEEESPGVILLTIPREETALLAGFKGQYDVQFSQNGTTRTVVQGAITIDADVTR